MRLKRKQAYSSLFDGFASEQEQLEVMFSPLRDVIGAEKGTLGKLTFSVRRIVDVEAWSKQGETPLDLRTGVFRGHGELLIKVKDKLLPAWEAGASADVADAMATFREVHDQHLIELAKVSRSDKQAYGKWAADIATWLNDTDHISVKHGVQYDGVAIEHLSPGTRGIVLLLLYLAVDQSDDRPLIIDQPEENLDPKSIFDERVDRFVETRHRRQIIIVTHNANLVVNTDADQVIVANDGAHRPGGLPEMTYISGGLENPVIRKKVCEILEGGQHAFEERAWRLRIRLGEEADDELSKSLPEPLHAGELGLRHRTSPAATAGSRSTPCSSACVLQIEPARTLATFWGGSTCICCCHSRAFCADN